MNLVGNAVKFTPSGGRVDATLAEVEKAAKDAEVVVDVVALHQATGDRAMMARIADADSPRLERRNAGRCRAGHSCSRGPGRGRR